MAHKTTLIDCSRLELLKLSHPACLAMVASACEVYPMECAGYMCCMKPPVRKGKARAVLPFQIANREKEAIDSESYRKFGRMLGDSNIWYILGSYHSHPCHSRRYEFMCEPSHVDLDGMSIGDLEIVVRVKRHRKRNINSWKTTSAGSISVAMGKFQFLLRAFVKEEGKRRDGTPNFRRVRMELE